MKAWCVTSAHLFLARYLKPPFARVHARLVCSLAYAVARLLARGRALCRLVSATRFLLSVPLIPFVCPGQRPRRGEAGGSAPAAAPGDRRDSGPVTALAPMRATYPSLASCQSVAGAVSLVRSRLAAVRYRRQDCVKAE
eukprot:6189460-Pleurochrysis_carterae.AAC.2